jgi:hypothetical protein
MSIIAKSNKKDFTPAPEGLHSAVCCDVVDLGLQLRSGVKTRRGFDFILYFTRFSDDFAC